MKVVIVGGVAGGASAAARLRRLDESAQIVLLERGEFISYANCGLPYFIGGEIADREALTLQTPASFRGRFAVDVRVRHEVVAIDPGAKTVQVRDLTTGSRYGESYDKLILSPGAEPVVPPILGVDDPRIFTLRTIPDTLAIDALIRERKPKTAVVIGGGAIGLEMAENLVRAGLAVTVVEMADHVVAPLDRELACEIHRHLRDKGVKLILGRGVKAFHSGKKELEVELADGSRLGCGMALLAIGVKPDTAIAREAGLQCNARGAIQVDERMETSEKDIYAVGDAVEIRHFVTGQPGYIPLAGPANKQGRIVADVICGLDSVFKGTQGSSVLRVFDLVAASTGLNEKAAKEAGLTYDKVYLYAGSHAGYYPGGSELCVKVLFGRADGKILGAQVVGGEGTDKRCDVLATAIRAGMTGADLAELELCYSPPFSSAKDPVNMAGFMIDNLLTGKVKQHHWHDVDALPRDGSATLLDVRTGGEVKGGMIGGAVHIPLHQLRGRMDELDKGKPVYVNCQSGLRSYVACRILSQNGFDCSNLAGGYRLYRTATDPAAR